MYLQGYETIMVKANQLLDELAEQKVLLEIQNGETMQNVQLLINMIRKYYAKFGLSFSN